MSAALRAGARIVTAVTSVNTRIAVLALALVAVAACGGESADSTTSAPTTTVETSAAEAVDLPDGIAATVDGFRIESGVLESQVPEGAGPGDLAQALRRLIVNQVLENEVRTLGISVSDADIADARNTILSEAGLPLEDILAASSLTEEAFELIVRQTALAEAVDTYLLENAPPPRDEDVQELYEQEVGNRIGACSAHILLETAADAQAALDRALAGEDFGDLARELSTGPSGPNGGDLGCGNPGDYVAPFANAVLEAEIGVPYGPVETQFGFHVVLVTERVIPTLDDMRDELAAALITDVFPVWLTAQIQRADIVVDSMYGTWIVDPPGVRPPA